MKGLWERYQTLLVKLNK